MTKNELINLLRNARQAGYFDGATTHAKAQERFENLGLVGKERKDLHSTYYTFRQTFHGMIINMDLDYGFIFIDGERVFP